MEGRHVLIVGGSRGIGAACGRRATEAGARASIIYRSAKESADRVVADITALGGKATSFAADASVEDELQAAIKDAVDEMGPIHGLVISAGIFEGAMLGDMTLEFWERTMRINLTSTFLSVKYAVPHIPTGSIVIVTSTAGQRGSADYSAYATSKGAQIMFMRSMALELAPLIRVNCVAPGWTDTDMADASLTRLGREEVSRSFPLGRIGEADDVADACIFLLSDASRFVTGTTLTVDGGSDMRG